jgi:hypothetical protein
MLPNELCDVARSLAELTGAWNPVEIVTADIAPLAKEKEMFLAAWRDRKPYNPVFNYSHTDQMDVSDSRKTLYLLAEQVRNINPIFLQSDKVSRLFQIALYVKIKDDLATCSLIEGIQRKNEKIIRKAVHQKYPSSDEALRLAALQIYSTMTQPVPDGGSVTLGLLSSDERVYIRSRNFTALQIKEVFEWALREFGILRTEMRPDGFQVVVTDKVMFIDVRNKSINGPTVFIPSTKVADGEELLGLLIHEIAAHARQSKNSELRYATGGESLKLDNDTMYEGLAMQYEDVVRRDMFGKDGSCTEPYYALAVERAVAGGSFHDVFVDQLNVRLHVALSVAPEDELPDFNAIDEVVLDSAKEGAWRTSYRIMRGHVDTTNPERWAMTKDLAYLRGRIQSAEQSAMSQWGMDQPEIIAASDLAQLIAFEVQSENIPIPFQNIAQQYWEVVLKPGRL